MSIKINQIKANKTAKILWIAGGVLVFLALAFAALAVNTDSSLPDNVNSSVTSTDNTLPAAVTAWNSSFEPQILTSGQFDSSHVAMVDVVSVGQAYWVNVLFSDNKFLSFANQTEPAGMPSFFQITYSTDSGSAYWSQEGLTSNATMSTGDQITLN